MTNRGDYLVNSVFSIWPKVDMVIDSEIDQSLPVQGSLKQWAWKWTLNQNQQVDKMVPVRSEL